MFFVGLRGRVCGFCEARGATGGGSQCKERVGLGLLGLELFERMCCTGVAHRLWGCERGRVRCDWGGCDWGRTREIMCICGDGVCRMQWQGGEVMGRGGSLGGRGVRH
jgi:hypothetical protein